MEAGIANKDTIVPLIQKAVRESKALAVNAPIFEKEVMDMILSKAETEMLAVAKQVAGKENALDEELKAKVKITITEVFTNGIRIRSTFITQGWKACG